MPIFAYQGIKQDGKRTKGTLDADSARSARAKLRSQGIFATELTESKTRKTTGSSGKSKYISTARISMARLAQETRQLSTLVGASIPIVEALQVMSDQCEHAGFKSTLIDVREKVEDGASLAKALGAFPRTFPRLYTNMVASGEASGKLDSALENLADHFEAQLELRRKIQSALFYPVLMFAICILVVVGLVTFVVPTITEIFEKEGAILPLPTQIMIVVSDLMTNYWWAVGGLVVVFFTSLVSWYRTPAGRRAIDQFWLRLPIVGSLYRKIYTARVATTLATLLSSGVQLLQAMDIVKNIVGNIHVVRAIEEARDGVREGRSLAKEFSKTGLFPQVFCQMIGIGERSGKLESMLNKAGKSFKNDVAATITGLTTLIEPAMIIGLGLLVLGIVVSVLMPMFDLMDKMQQ